MLTAIAVAFLALPLIAIFTQGSLREGLQQPGAWTALKISFETSAVSLGLMLVFGTPIAYMLATTEFRGKTLLTTLFELPLVLPPAVAGLGLLMAFGRFGLIGPQLSALGIEIPFTKAAVVMAMTFVACPLYVRQAVSAFEAVDVDLLGASRTLGAGPARTFFRRGHPGGSVRPQRRCGARVGACAGRVRRDHPVRREPAGGDGDGAGGDLPRLRPEPQPGAGAGGAADRGQCIRADLRQTADSGTSVSLHARLTYPLRSFTLDAEVEVAEATAVIGPSGAGKSTLLRLIAGLLTPASGRIECDGEVWYDGQRSTPADRRRVGFVFQDYALFPHMSVRANVAYGARVAVNPLLERIGIDHLAKAKPRALSGGERQRVALARALARDPKLLLLDEPLSALDPGTRGRIADELSATVAEVGVPTLIVTHSFDEAVALANRVIVLEEGRITQVGLSSELLRAPQTAFVAQFAGLNHVEGVADGLGVVLDSGDRIRLAEPASGRIAVLIPPWDITLGRHRPGDTSAQNHLTAPISHILVLGNRVRVSVGPVTAEITAASSERLGLKTGETVTASFKSTAIRTIRLEHPG